MNLAHPFELITPTLDGDVLAVLARTEASFTPGQVQRLVGHGSLSGIRKVLQRLSSQGVVRAEMTPNAVLYSLNGDHLATPAIIAVANLRSELLERMRERLEAWSTPPVYAALFGSAARGEMRTDSDLDVLIIRPSDIDADAEEWRANVASFASEVSSATGNDVRVLEYGVDEIGDLADGEEPVLDSVRSEAITITGYRDVVLGPVIRRRMSSGRK